MIQPIYTSVSNADIVPCGKRKPIKSDPIPLLRNNYLGEYRTELERAKVRKNLGIADEQSLLWGNIDGTIEEQKDLVRYIEQKWQYSSDVSEDINTVKDALDYALYYISKYEDNTEEIEQLSQQIAEVKQSIEETESELQQRINENSESIGLINTSIQSINEQIVDINEAIENIDVDKNIQNWITRNLENSKTIKIEDSLEVIISDKEDNAIHLVTEAIIRSRAGIKDPNRPIGSFIFLGPTGVGKTEVAKALAEELFDDEKHMIRIDMSEYMEKFSVSRLIGSPPGYVGYEEGGELTEKVRRNPYSIILFDEIEKAHPEVLNLLLQILDDGRCTDSQGRTVDFKNTIIILTSNLGSEYILEGINDKGELTEEAKDKVEKLLKQSFRPEFLNRLDEIVFYKPLTQNEIGKILDLLIADLNKRLAEQEISVELTNSAKDYLITNGYDAVYGARPLKRFVQKKVETLIAREIIKQTILPKEKVTIDCKDNELVIVK